MNPTQTSIQTRAKKTFEQGICASAWVSEDLLNNLMRITFLLAENQFNISAQKWVCERLEKELKKNFISQKCNRLKSKPSIGDFR